MGDGLSTRGGGAVVRGSGVVATLGPAADSTERLSFGGKVLTWADLPAATRRAARRGTPLIAEAVQRDGRTWTEQGHAVERATGWRVHEDAVVVAEVVRRLTPAATRGLRPSGPWRHHRVDVLEAAGPARRRRGVVDVATELGDTPGGAVWAPAQVAGAEAWPFLPLTVRTAAERLVPDPVLWVGELVQEASADGFPTRQDVRALRMSRERAVAVLATRTLAPIPGADLRHHATQMARVPWVVEQVGLDLGATAARVLLDRS